MCYITFNILCLRHSCIPRINLTWSWCLNLLMCCWISLTSCQELFHLHVSGILVCSFFQCPYVALVSAQCWPQKISLRVFPPLQILETFEKHWLLYFLNVGWNSPVKPSGLGFLFWNGEGTVFDYWFILLIHYLLGV